ncbi:uncharacterized protein [Nicotiana sylvestris]|uniref:uncharacterized protein n=1 Tax=Nicotiana sylvestris TaxID=4096 RepID=UPI00388CD099
MIKKLPPLWKDFKNYLKYKCKEISLEDLIGRLRIEKDNKAAKKRGRGTSTIMGANIIEDTSQNKRKRKHASGSKSNPSKKRFNGNWEAFATYAPVGPEETLSMGNAATAKIEGCGKIFLKMTSGKVVISKNEMFVGKGYLTKGLFKLNVMIVENNNKISVSSYLLESNEL